MPSSKRAAEELDEAVSISRVERKERTRQRLIDAALTLIGRGRGFTSLSLREIAREAGVVPAAFYRHFRSVDELGLALVDQAGAALRRVMREARYRPSSGHVLRDSVLTFKRFVEEHSLVFRFVTNERGGGSRVIRNAIRAEEAHNASEMAQDMRTLGFSPSASTATMQMIAGLVVTTLLNAASDILDLPEDQPKQEEELVDYFVHQVQLIFLGAKHWQDH
ncbi:MAG: HTH-type transcriptional repressor FabR [Lysobacter sp.]